MKKIKLTNSDKECYVSDEDFEFVSQWKWYLTGRAKYATSSILLPNGKRKMVLLHRVIYERMTEKPIPQGFQIDHVNRNPIDNTRENLRLATWSQNMRNRAVKNISGYIGVYRYIRKRKHKDKTFHITYHWRAHIQGDKEYAKNFPFTEEGKIAAAKWRDEMAKKLHGEFAALNFPDTDTKNR